MSVGMLQCTVLAGFGRLQGCFADNFGVKAGCGACMLSVPMATNKSGHHKCQGLTCQRLCKSASSFALPESVPPTPVCIPRYFSGNCCGSCSRAYGLLHSSLEGMQSQLDGCKGACNRQHDECLQRQKELSVADDYPIRQLQHQGSSTTAHVTACQGSLTPKQAQALPKAARHAQRYWL